MKLKAEGGQGGKRGHSNMVHHAKTAEVKAAARLQRREEGKKTLGSELKAMGWPVPNHGVDASATCLPDR
jgi:hypothetical protein